MRQLLPLVSMLSLVMLLGGCASNKSTPQVAYYQLPSIAAEQPDGSVGLPPARLSVARVSTTEILAQTGIVTAAADDRVIVANYTHWSELPEFALERSLSGCLQTSKTRQSGKINLSVEAFQSDGAGGSLFAGVWEFAPAAKPRATRQYRFRYREKLSGDGYPALVSALAQSVRLLCTDIVKQLR